jgi:sugar fermentation stimulation protein A
MATSTDWSAALRDRTEPGSAADRTILADGDRMDLFSPDATGRLVSRPNRFTLMVDLDGVDDSVPRDDGAGPVAVHAANPGRMWEPTYPGTEVILQRARGNRKTEWTAVAVRRPADGVIVPLVAAGANRIARELILPRLLPEATAIRGEVSRGHSRFDFVADTSDGEIVIEVKSCTLVAHGVAMFPDAATSRGARHVAELAALTSERRIVLFVIQGAPAERFVPDIHTDPAFAVALRDAAVRGVEVVAVGTATTAEGITTITNPAVPVDFGPVASVDGDCGSYLLHMRLDEPRRVAIGALGEFDLEAGHYLYVGSAMGSLKSRTSRHMRRRKRMRGHVDYLRSAADWASVYPIYSEERLECSVAASLREAFSEPIPGFGASDCACGSHLFFTPDDPRRDPAFVERVLLFRHREALGR